MGASRFTVLLALCGLLIYACDCGKEEVVGSCGYTQTCDGNGSQCFDHCAALCEGADYVERSECLREDGRCLCSCSSASPAAICAACTDSEACSPGIEGDDWCRTQSCPFTVCDGHEYLRAASCDPEREVCDCVCRWTGAASCITDD